MKKAINLNGSVQKPEDKTAAAKVYLPVGLEQCVKAGISLTIHQHSMYATADGTTKELLYCQLISEFHSQTGPSEAFAMASWCLKVLKESGAPKISAYRVAMFAYHLWHDNFESDSVVKRRLMIKEATNKLVVILSRHDHELVDSHKTGIR